MRNCEYYFQIRLNFIMSRQVSLFKFFDNKNLSKSVVKTPKSSEAENNIKRDVRLLLKDVVKNVVDSEIKKK